MDKLKRNCLFYSCWRAPAADSPKHWASKGLTGSGQTYCHPSHPLLFSLAAHITHIHNSPPLPQPQLGEPSFQTNPWDGHFSLPWRTQSFSDLYKQLNCGFRWFGFSQRTMFYRVCFFTPAERKKGQGQIHHQKPGGFLYFCNSATFHVTLDFTEAAKQSGWL